MAAEVDHDAEIERLFADPLQRLQQILARDEDRLEARRHDIAEARQALLQLVASFSRPDDDARGTPVWEVVSAELAPALLQHLLASATEVVRSSVLSLDVGPGLDRETIEQGQQHLREGRFRQRTLYPMDVMDVPLGRDWIRSWAAAGEVQRLSLAPPSDFAIFDDVAVVAVADWGDAAADYVLIREPMIVAAFTTLFDRSFERGLPVTADQTGADDPADDLRLLRLLARGLKDESIARYLGVSLRTVRRRVAHLMDVHAAQTRFQLGVAVARADLVTLGGPDDR
jgi:DNA-binding CsgD family transcriptional regulator